MSGWVRKWDVPLKSTWGFVLAILADLPTVSPQVCSSLCRRVGLERCLDRPRFCTHRQCSRTTLANAANTSKPKTQACQQNRDSLPKGIMCGPDSVLELRVVRFGRPLRRNVIRRIQLIR